MRDSPIRKAVWRRHTLLLAVAATAAVLGGCTETPSMPQTAGTSGSGIPSPAVESDRAGSPRLALARQYFKGDGRPPQPERGVELLRAEAGSGNPEAQFLLGLAYRDGRGVAEDTELAYRLFESAASQGHADATYLAALALYRGKGVPTEPAKAAERMRSAANAGHAAARYHMGVFYRLGVGVAPDAEAAARWFELAAEQGYPEATAEIATAYENGAGVPKDLAWALRWHERAAEYGVERSQFKLGVLIGTGRGLPRDRVTGLKWLLLAAQGGSIEAKRVLEPMKSRMTPAEIRRAEAAARYWKPAAAGVVDPDDPATIRFIQAALNDVGIAAGPIDGIEGPRTRTAIERFRRREALDDDAWIDDRMLRELRDERRRRIG